MAIFIVSTIMSCQPKSLPTFLETDQNFATVKVSHETTKTEMETIKDSLSKIGIDFDYSGSTFFDDSRLQTLNLAVTLSNGKIGTLTADAVNLQFKYFGFIYNSEKFKIGEIMD